MIVLYVKMVNIEIIPPTHVFLCVLQNCFMEIQVITINANHVQLDARLVLQELMVTVIRVMEIISSKIIIVIKIVGLDSMETYLTINVMNVMVHAKNALVLQILIAPVVKLLYYI